MARPSPLFGADLQEIPFLVRTAWGLLLCDFSLGRALSNTTPSPFGQRQATRRGAQAPTLIVVDDDDDIREALSTLLSLEGHDVRGAVDGVEGLCLISEFSGDQAGSCIVLLEMMMPDMSGAEVMQVLREAEQLPKLPVVVISATTPVPADVAGARLCLHKPLDADTVLAVVRRLSASVA